LAIKRNSRHDFLMNQNLEPNFSLVKTQFYEKN
jgi:hypothetical protein